MKLISYIMKVMLISLAVSIILRVIFGLYSVFGALALIPAALMGLIAALSTAPSSTVGYAASSTVHMLLVVAFSVIFDMTGVLRTLASSCADFFAGAVGLDGAKLNILWCILFVAPVYFLCYTVFAFIASLFRAASRRRVIEAEEITEEDHEMSQASGK